MPWNLFADRRPETPSLWTDLRHGKLTTFGRIILSVTGFGAALVLCLVSIAVVSPNRRVPEELVATVLGLGGLLWVLLLTYLWFGHSILGPLLRGVFVIGAIWFLTIILAVFIGARLPNNELWIGAFVISGITATVLFIASMIYSGVRGQAIRTQAGQVNVQCPECGYSFVGKMDCTCPECGRQYTVDELIAAQNYDALRRDGEDKTPPAITTNALKAPHHPALPAD